MTELQRVYTSFKKIIVDKNPYFHIVKFNDVHTIDDYVYGSKTMLESAASHNINDIVKRCIQLGAKLDTPLYCALKQHNFKTAEILLKAGANPNMKIDGVPLICSMSTWYFHEFYDKVINILLKYGALLNTIPQRCRHLFVKHVAHRKWVLLRAVMKLLSLHHRAVVTANHPLRKLVRGEFNDESLECC